VKYIPDWFSFVVLALAAYRTWRLIAEDDILNRPRKWLLRLPREWADGDEEVDGYRKELHLFLFCPWCAGFWISLAWWGAWMIFGDWATVFAVPWAMSLIVGVVRRNLDPPA